ncbi:MAG TPA: EF-hand domain-containing protein [Sphingomicrobium sp.]|nr:EF-hand domain-containing protein [Sphingomicrobium sp.]
MPLPLFLLALGPIASSAPITVTGHQWAPFISPMGEPFRAHSATDDTLADWFREADLNHDGELTAAEMQTDAEGFFAKLDTNHDGQIDPDELAKYEYEVAPEIQVMSRTRRAPGQPAPLARPGDADDLDLGDQAATRDDRRATRDEAYASLGFGGGLEGAARYSLLNMPEPVAAADTDFNRAITLEEFRQAAIARFQLLDTAHQGRITLPELEAMPHVPTNERHHHRLDEKAPDTRIGDPLPSGP